MAATHGHIGVIKSLLGTEKAQERYREGQFRLVQRRLEVLGESATQPSAHAARNNPDEFSPLAVALLEQQT